MISQIRYLMHELRLNRSFASRVALVIIRLERISYFRILLLPFRVIILNFFFNTEIPRSVVLGPGLRLVHPYGVILHSSVQIGANVTIMHRVTVGRNEFKSSGITVIGDNCHFGVGVSVFGPLQIGNNVVVRAHSIISKSVLSFTYVKNVNEFVPNKYCVSKDVIVK